MSNQPSAPGNADDPAARVAAAHFRYYDLVMAAFVAILLLSNVLGAGKRLFEGFEHDLDLEIVRVYTSPLATHVRYAVRR